MKKPYVSELSEGEAANLCAEPKPKLELSGSDGNAFMVIGKAIGVARKAGWSQEEIEKFRQEAMAGDYDHLLRVCMDYFDVD